MSIYIKKKYVSDHEGSQDCKSSNKAELISENTSCAFTKNSSKSLLEIFHAPCTKNSSNSLLDIILSFDIQINIV